MGAKPTCISSAQRVIRSNTVNSSLELPYIDAQIRRLEDELAEWGEIRDSFVIEAQNFELERWKSRRREVVDEQFAKELDEEWAAVRSRRMEINLKARIPESSRRLLLILASARIRTQRSLFRLLPTELLRILKEMLYGNGKLKIGVRCRHAFSLTETIMWIDADLNGLSLAHYLRHGLNNSTVNMLYPDLRVLLTPGRFKLRGSPLVSVVESLDILGITNGDILSDRDASIDAFAVSIV